MSMEALSNQAGSSRNSEWYRGTYSTPEPPSQLPPGKIYPHLLGLNKEELRLLSKSWTCDDLASFIKEVDEETKRKVHGETYERARSLLYTFSDLARRLSDIVKLMPLKSEYSAALGAMAVLLSCLSAKAEMEAKILNQIRKIRDVLLTVDYLADAVHNTQMATAISGICSEIVNYLCEVIAYVKKPRIEKLVGALITSNESRFGKYVESIESHITKIRSLQSTVNLAVSFDTMNKLDQRTSLGNILKEFKDAMASMADKIDKNNEIISKQLSFTALLQTQNIREVLLPEQYSVDQIASVVDSQQSLLALPEQWENRGFEGDVRGWLQRKSRPLLYISGEPKANRISFLSPFMVDLAEVLSLEPNVGVSYVFCDTDSIDSNMHRLTPDFVLRQLIGQLLSAYPHLAIGYVNELSLSRFRAIGKSTNSAFELLRDVLLKARDQIEWPKRGYFILIDRVDLVQDVRDCHVSTEFLPMLQRLGTRFDDINVVVTTSIASTAVPALTHDELLLQPITVGPAKKTVPYRQG